MSDPGCDPDDAWVYAAIDREIERRGGNGIGMALDVLLAGLGAAVLFGVLMAAMHAVGMAAVAAGSSSL